MSPGLETVVEQTMQALRKELGENLYSCCLYGSAVRGNFIEGRSDINLLIIVGQSDPAAHEAIGRAIAKQELVDPFIIAREALPRTVRVFAAKFDSIKRNYRVIHGPDPLAELQIDPALERFLCEQALRNLQLRMIYAFVTRARTNSYQRFLLRSITPLFVQMSEVLRLEGLTVPKEFEPRIELFERQFKVQGNVLRQLLSLKTDPKQQRRETDEFWHEHTLPVINGVLCWVDNHWPAK